MKITTIDFLLRYWRNYIEIEKEFALTSNFVSIDENNFNTYSDAYIKILLQVGSAIDITCKLLCNLLGTSMKDGTINKYQKIILEKIPDFSSVLIKVKNSILEAKPWESWKDESVPSWWTVYNKVKHHRLSTGTIDGIKKEYYKFANLKYTMYSLMALYQVMLYSYYYLAQLENKKVFVPLPASRLFETNSHLWKNVSLGSTFAFCSDNETLDVETGPFDY